MTSRQMSGSRVCRLARAVVLIGLVTPCAASAKTEPATSTTTTSSETRLHAIIASLNGDTAALAPYLTADVTVDGHFAARGQTALLRALADLRKGRTIHFAAGQMLTDDASGDMAVELTLRQVAQQDGVTLIGRKAPVRAGDTLVSRRMVFLRWRGDRIATIHFTPETDFVRQVSSAAAQAEEPTPEMLREPLPATVDLPVMTAAKFRDYLKLFGRFDPRYVLYYDPDVVFDTAPAPAPIVGRQAVFDFYAPLRKYLDEHIDAPWIVIDTRASVLAAEIHNRRTAARGDVQMPSRLMKMGEERDGSGVVIYQLKAGRIARIQTGPKDDRFEPVAPR